MSSFGILGTVIAAILGYLIGSFSWSIFIGKTFYKIDPRDYYSKNAGATNTSRVIGTKMGLIIMFLDMFKTTMAALLAFAISFIKFDGGSFETMSYLIPGLFAIIGHCWPVYYKFKGGKGVASFLGLLLTFNPILFGIAAFIWWAIFLPTRKISLASIVMGAILVFITWIPQLSLVNKINTDFLLLKDISVLWITYMHTINTELFLNQL